mmetsp:Transcript_9288/g.23084  ORF Transcript_9288/g.23084 Transcript_9288/m.23084 type:complete len:661 (+) Transcript_9288:247-2229(+)
MDSPNISIRIRRHETLPCHALRSTHAHRPSAKASTGQNSNRSFPKASVLIGRRLGATKNNPYVGSFRHAPPTSLRSMAASSLPSLSSMKEAGSSSMFLTPSFAFAANSPYVGWFRHAPPVVSSYQYLDSFPSGMKNTNNSSNKTRTRRTGSTTKSTKKSSIVQHKVNPDSLLELDRWHHQLASLMLGMSNEDSEKSPPLLLRQIINGRLLGGSEKDDRHASGSGNSNENNIIQRCNSIYQLNSNGVAPLALSRAFETIHQTGYGSTVLSRLTSWLSNPLIYADDDCYDEYGCLKDNYDNKNGTKGLKLLLSRPPGDRSIEIDSDETDEEDEDGFSSTSSIDYDPCGESSIPEGLSSEVEREFSTEANLSVSEIAEAYYAHQLLDESRRRSNSDATTTSQQSGLSPSSLNPSADYNGDESRQRLDYEITQMDIARMTRNASRHLDVDSILNLPTIVYRKRRKSTLSSPSNSRNRQNFSQSDQSYHNVCTPIREDRCEATVQGGCIIIKGTENEKSFLSEDGWSFMMVSDMKPSPINDSLEKRTIDNGEDNASTATISEDEMCVICLESFREGDRLRVLPCNHSFHVGCIDRWLSGTHSHNECFTAGCPTCKKRPSLKSSQTHLLHTAETNEGDMSGSLPSWAFANLGSVMAMSSGDVFDDN